MEAVRGAMRMDEKVEEILEEEEAAESGVTLSFASAPDELITMVAHTLCCFQSTHFLSTTAWNLHLSQKEEETIKEATANRKLQHKWEFMQISALYRCSNG